MKDSIIVNVSELRSMIQDIRRSGCELVSVSINEAEEFNGDVIPASISFSACKSYSPDEWIDFEDVEAVPNEVELSKKASDAMHMSSNLF